MAAKKKATSPRMGRPALEVPRGVKITVRLTEPEAAELGLAADAAGVSTTEMARRRVVDKRSAALGKGRDR